MSITADAPNFLKIRTREGPIKDWTIIVHIDTDHSVQAVSDDHGWWHSGRPTMPELLSVEGITPPKARHVMFCVRDVESWLEGVQPNKAGAT